METLEFPQVIHWAIPAFLLTIVLELWWSTGAQRGSRVKGYTWKDTLCSLSLGIGNVVIGFGATKLSLWMLESLWAHRVFDLQYHWWVLIAALVLDDFRYYWQHRWGHELRWAWAAHVTHHSSQYYNLSTALRQTWTSTLTGLFVLSAPLALMGFHPKLILFCASINLLYQYWIHTEVVERGPTWFEYIFNTPSHHRVHHGKNPEYLDANYGGILIVWDRLFGTFTPERDEEVVEYGLVHDIESYNPVVAAFHEWIAIARDLAIPGLSLGDRLRYMFGRPGWSHDGSRKTSVELKKAAAANKPRL